MSITPQTIISFGEETNAFRAVDDRVMGGVSRSTMETSADGHGVFRGELSLENNGGFASVRASDLDLDLSSMSGLALRVRGDGQRYKLRLQDAGRANDVSFETAFDTTSGQWVELALPLDEFRPVWRGRAVPDAAPLNRARISVVGLMIADGQQGPFSLELDWLAGH